MADVIIYYYFNSFKKIKKTFFESKLKRKIADVLRCTALYCT